MPIFRPHGTFSAQRVETPWLRHCIHFVKVYILSLKISSPPCIYANAIFD